MDEARIGIRELREGLSRAIRRVRDGQTIEITDRGKPVARIVPVASARPAALERLIDEATVYPPVATRRRLPPLELPSVMTSEEAIEILRGG